jgi:predicted glycosyltransferase
LGVLDEKMRIFVDIAHYPHMNLFKNAIFYLRDKGIDVRIIVQPRGNLTSMLKYEYGLPYESIGHYQPSMFRKILNLIIRDIKILNYLRSNQCDVMTGVGSINLTHAAFVLRKPSVMFEDDIEYKLAYYPYKYFATNIVMPECIHARGKNILKYKGFKELAYLHPNYFTPSKSVLMEYNLTPNNYVFIREVSNTTLNYSELKEGLLSKVCPYLKDMGFDIVLSLENKQLKKEYEDYCVILNEPVRDIHSLLHYASLSIVSGDSMARESCLVGTPAIYAGKRDMAINRELIKKGCFFKVDNVSNVMQQVRKIIENDIKKETEYTLQKAIKNEWDDTTQVILDVLLSKLYNDDALIEKYKMGVNNVQR